MPESGADTDLAEAIRAKGHQVSARQIRSWREADVLPTTTVQHLGRGRGTVASYPDGALDVALGLAQALDEDRNLHRAVLVAFVRGVAVGDDALRRAYKHTCRAMADSLRLARSQSGLTRKVRFPQVPRPRGRPPKDGPSYNEMAESLVAVALGEGDDGTELHGFLGAVDGQLTEGLHSDAVGQIAAEFGSLLGIAARATAADRAELEAARDLLKMVRSDQGLAAVFPFLPEVLGNDLTLALLVPLMSPLARSGLT